MPKRKNPFGECSRFQLKLHVDNKVMDKLSCESNVNMQKIYDKTLRLLHEGSKHIAQHNSLSGDIICECGALNLQQQLTGQTYLDQNGQLQSSLPFTGQQTSTQNSVRNSDDLEAMNTENLQDVQPLKPDCMKPVKTDPSYCINMCHGCGKTLPSAASPINKCNWCFRMICTDCLRNCVMCHCIFCPVCSIINYDEYTERSFCLQCASC